MIARGPGPRVEPVRRLADVTRVLGGTHDGLLPRWHAAQFGPTTPADFAVARGDLDLNAVARRELASRGLDQTGTWVGFEQASARHRR